MQPGISLDLPEATSAEFQEEPPGLVIYISRFGDIYLNEQFVTFDDLLPVISENLQRQSRPQVTIQADKEVAFGFFVRILDVAKEAGGEDLIISAEFPQ